MTNTKLNYAVLSRPLAVLVAFALALVVAAGSPACLAHADEGASAPSASDAGAASIQKTSLDRAEVEVKHHVLYTGKAVTPAVKVTLDGARLVEGKDYILDFDDNRQVGQARVTARGVGDYAGSKHATFLILDSPIIAIADTDEGRTDKVMKLLRRSGIEGRWISNAHVDIDLFDGLILPGGVNDVDPALYGQEVMGSEYPNRKLDLMQFKLIERFIDAGKPVLGICRGHQVVNVYFGGSMIQDLGGYHKHWHMSKLEKDSWLGSTFGSWLNTFHWHHQAVDQVGDGLVVVARDVMSDYVEAIEHETLPVWGIQFHAEAMGINGKRIAKKFAKECLVRI